MKFNYDLTKNIFKNINLYVGIQAQKKKLKKHPTKKVLSATTQGLKLLGYTLIGFILLCLSIYFKQKLLEYVLYYLTLIQLLVALSFFVTTIISYMSLKKALPRGTIEVTKEGIIDVYKNKASISLPWSEIDCIVIKKNTLAIISKVPQLHLIATIKDNEKEKFITACKKYDENILIINKMEK